MARATIVIEDEGGGTGVSVELDLGSPQDPTNPQDITSAQYYARFAREVLEWATIDDDFVDSVRNLIAEIEKEYEEGGMLDAIPDDVLERWDEEDEE